MSLIHWYPLNNSLEDFGCGQAITSSISGTPTFSNTGKIGNYCLTASETLTITDSTLAGARIWSCCFWGYVVSASIPNNWTGLFHITDGSSNIRVEVCPKGNYANDIYCYSIHNNSGNAIFSSNIPRISCVYFYYIAC